MVVKDRRPHLTLADYHEIELEKLSTLLHQYFENEVQVPLQFNALGSFIGRKMLYLAPRISKELLDFHGNYHEHFKQFNQNENSYYLPKNWVPHCSIAGRLTDETILQAFEFCHTNMSQIHTKIAEVGLVEVFFNEEGNIVKDRLMMSKKLNETQS